LIRIDAHQHFWHFNEAEYPWITPQMGVLRQDLLPPALHAELRREGIDASIAVQARNTIAETDYLLSLAAGSPFIAGVIGWVDLRAGGLVQCLERWLDEPTLRGFRHTLQSEPDVDAYVNDSRFRRSLQHLQNCGYVYEVLVRGPQLAAAVALCGRHAAQRLVLDHLGKPAVRADTHAEWARQLQPLREMPHVVCKLSGLVTETDLDAGGFEDRVLWPYLDTALEVFGAQRLMFGSDWPVCLLAASYQRVHRIVREWSAQLSAHEQAALWGGTAIQTYGLKRESGAWI